MDLEGWWYSWRRLCGREGVEEAVNVDVLIDEEIITFVVFASATVD